MWALTFTLQNGITGALSAPSPSQIWRLEHHRSPQAIDVLIKVRSTSSLWNCVLVISDVVGLPLEENIDPFAGGDGIKSLPPALLLHTVLGLRHLILEDTMVRVANPAMNIGGDWTHLIAELSTTPLALWSHF